MKIYIHTLIKILQVIIVYSIAFLVVKTGLKLVHQESLFSILSGVLITALGFAGFIYYTIDLVEQILSDQNKK